MEEFKYVGVLLTSEDRSEREISRRIGVSSATVTVLVHFGEEKAEPESITQFGGRSSFQYRPMVMISGS